MHSSRLLGSGEWFEMEIRGVGVGGKRKKGSGGVAVFSCSLFLTPPHYLNAWNRLVQFDLSNPQLKIAMRQKGKKFWND